MRLLSKEVGEELEPDTTVLGGFVRKKLREKFLEADIENDLTIGVHGPGIV